MDVIVRFSYQKKIYGCNIYIDCSEYPCYIFVELLDKELICAFGDDITIKTDGENSLSRNHDYPELVTIRRAIFNAIKMTTAFQNLKKEIMLLKPRMEILR